MNVIIEIYVFKVVLSSYKSVYNHMETIDIYRYLP